MSKISIPPANFSQFKHCTSLLEHKTAAWNSGRHICFIGKRQLAGHIHFYAVVQIGRLMGLARPCVCPSVRPFVICF